MHFLSNCVISLIVLVTLLSLFSAVLLKVPIMKVYMYECVMR